MHNITSIARIEVPYGSALTSCARGSPSQIGATYAAADSPRQIPLDGLTRDRSLTRCDNHLTVGQGHTARGIETSADEDDFSSSCHANGPIFQFVAPANLTTGFVCMCGDDAKREPRDSAYTAVNSAPNRNICDA